MSLEGKVCLVTGASSGIGLAIAKALVNHKCVVFIGARRLDRLKESADELSKSGGTVVPLELDVTSESSVAITVEHIISKYQRIDILVNNAGVMLYGSIEKAILSEWIQMIDVNCKGVAICTAKVSPYMLKQKSGHIINITSDAGKKVFSGLAVYCGTKYFVEAMMEGIREEFAENKANVKVTNIQPGNTNTELFGHSSDKETLAKHCDITPNEILEPEQIAEAVMYALSQPKNCAINEILIEPTTQPI